MASEKKSVTFKLKLGGYYTFDAPDPSDPEPAVMRILDCVPGSSYFDCQMLAAPASGPRSDYKTYTPMVRHVSLPASALLVWKNMQLVDHAPLTRKDLSALHIFLQSDPQGPCFSEEEATETIDELIDVSSKPQNTTMRAVMKDDVPIFEQVA